MWHAKPLHYDYLNLSREKHCIAEVSCDWLKDRYLDEELFYKHSQLKISIYNFLKKILPLIPTFGFISLNFILLAIVGFLFLKKKDILLLYTCSSNIAGIGASIIFCVFTPVTDARYIYPVLISTIIAVIGLIAYIVKRQKIKIKDDNI